MKLTYKLVSTVIAAAMVSQSVVALAQEAPSTPAASTALTATGAAQDRSQEKQLRLLSAKMTEVNTQGQQIQNLVSSLKQARREGNQYVLDQEAAKYWMGAADTAIVVGGAMWAILSATPTERLAFKGAYPVNQAFSALNKWKRAAKITFILGIGVAIPATYEYVHQGSKVKIAEGDVQSILDQVEAARLVYNTKVEAYNAAMEEMRNQITEHNTNKSLTINGLNFPQLRTLQGSPSGILQFQNLGDANNQ